METITKSVTNEHANIKGWGVDADRENEPTYPMKKSTGDDRKRLNYERPTQQPVDVEILHSNERPSVTAVFGTSTPPSGLSGMIRRFAFRYSESSWGHWLPLILADRVNMVEGIVDDFKQGTIPNFMAERGWNAEWKYNKQGVIRNVIVGAAIATAVVTLIALKNRNSDED
jgi:hypothetical protein